MIKTYYMLTKPGIIMGNLITTAAGFALASQGSINFSLFFLTLLGLGLVIASACVFNNYLDRYSDEKMARTKNRALVKGLISIRNALSFAVIVGVIGIMVLGMFTNLLTAGIASIGFVVYVFLYSIMKHLTIHGTLIGSIAGAIPPVVGYTAVSDSLDLAALLLFAIVALWQMPHFFAIAMYRLEDYTRASIPVLPVIKGVLTTKIHMVFYVIAFLMAALTLPFFGYTGYAYLIVTALLGITWLWLSIKGFTCANNTLWARKMFIFSLIVITAISIMMSVDVSNASTIA